jgi:hypothetical protein
MTKRAILTLAVLLTSISVARPQTLIRTAAPGPDEIVPIKTAQGITTRISFPDIVKEIICGDLYDPASGHGAFVVQRGDNDVFIKPVSASGTSNLFVRIGPNPERVYTFDLLIVPASQACRVLNVVAEKNRPSARAYQSPEAARIISDAERQAEQIDRAADRRVVQMLSEAERRRAESESKLTERAGYEVSQRFIRAMMTGIHEIRTGSARADTKGIAITLDRCALSLDGKLYLRYTIQNLTGSDLVFQRLSLESGSGENKKVIKAHIAQSKSENSLKPREGLAGVITFEQNAVNLKEGLTLCVRGENTEIARVSVSK